MDSSRVPSSSVNTPFVIREADMDILGEGGYQIISALIGNPSTVKQLAIRFSLSRARTKYIVDWLIAKDAVMLTHDLVENGHLEQYYESKIKDFKTEIRHDKNSEALAFIGQLAVDSLKEHIVHRSQERQAIASLKLLQCRVPVAQLNRFASSVEALFKEFEGLEDLDGKDEIMLLCGFYSV